MKKIINAANGCIQVKILPCVQFWISLLGEDPCDFRKFINLSGNYYGLGTIVEFDTANWNYLCAFREAHNILRESTGIKFDFFDNKDIKKDFVSKLIEVSTFWDLT